jgi:DNA polymerase IV
MADKELADKQAYFKEQELLDISDDETGFPDEGLKNAQRLLLAKAKSPEKEKSPPAPPPPRRKTYGFLGPTPRERQAQFERERQLALARNAGHGLIRSLTAPDPAVASASFPSADGKRKASDVLPDNSSKSKKLKHSHSLSDIPTQLEFYKRVGDVPRPLSKAKKDAVIKLEPERKQLLKGKIICE